MPTRAALRSWTRLVNTALALRGLIQCVYMRLCSTELGCRGRVTEHSSGTDRNKAVPLCIALWSRGVGRKSRERKKKRQTNHKNAQVIMLSRFPAQYHSVKECIDTAKQASKQSIIANWKRNPLFLEVIKNKFHVHGTNLLHFHHSTNLLYFQSISHTCNTINCTLHTDDRYTMNGDNPTV